MAEPYITIRGLRKSYVMGANVIHALDGLDVEIERNAFIAVIGPSGSGESTLLHMLGGLDRPTAGSIAIDGTSLETMDEHAPAEYRPPPVGALRRAAAARGSGARTRQRGRADPGRRTDRQPRHAERRPHHAPAGRAAPPGTDDPGRQSRPAHHPLRHPHTAPARRAGRLRRRIRRGPGSRRKRGHRMRDRLPYRLGLALLLVALFSAAAMGASQSPPVLQTPEPSPPLFPRPVLTLTSYSASGAVTPGNDFTMTFRVANQGGAKARNIVFTIVPGDFLPSGSGGVISGGVIAPGADTGYSQS